MRTARIITAGVVLVSLAVFFACAGGDGSSSRKTRKATATKKEKETPEKVGPTSDEESAARSPGTTEQPTDPRDEWNDVPLFTADAVFAAYEANALNADRAFKNRRLRVTGAVVSIDEDILGSPYVALETENVIACVQCMFSRDRTNDLVDVRQGDQVVIGGVCDGKFMNVIIRKCILLETGATIRAEAEARRNAEAELRAEDAKLLAEEEARQQRERDRERRTQDWIDKSGKFRVRATLVAYGNGIVYLEKEDGTVIDVPLEKLSIESRELLQKEIKRGDLPKTPPKSSDGDP
ncbi:MAG: OB-fold protein [Planctomycetota bacterium]|jgi:hypothetical protein